MSEGSDNPMKAALTQLIARQDMSSELTRAVCEHIVSGQGVPEQVAAFMVLLEAKGATADEVVALAHVMLEHATPANVPGELLDIVGTGGDGFDTINFSTTAAILAAACGARVCKHGSRSATSQSGSADVLEHLGVRMLQPPAIAPCVERAGIAFMFAPLFHPAMKHVLPVRRALGVRTIFNILGPLLNPARAQYLCLGVHHPRLLSLYGAALSRDPRVRRALVVHCCGLDELAPLGVAKAVEVSPGAVRELDIDTLACGAARCTVEDLKGGPPEHNARVIRELLAGGAAAEGPIADTVALNTGAALYISGAAPSIAEGFARAKAVLKSGQALTVLDKWAAACQELASGDTPLPSPTPRS